MIKSELVLKIAEANPHLYQRDVENIVNAILDEISGAMARGDRVELRGFGAFSVKARPARLGRNPRTGAHVEVDEKVVPFFKTGKDMRVRLNKPSGRSTKGHGDDETARLLPHPRADRRSSSLSSRSPIATGSRCRSIPSARRPRPSRLRFRCSS